MSLSSDSPGPQGPRPHAILTTLAGAATGPAFVAARWAVVATLPRSAMALRDEAPLRAPARLVITFGRPSDPALFEGHYQVEHLPLVLAIPHISSVESALVADHPAGTRRTYHWRTTLACSSVRDLVASVSSREGQAALTHIAMFATGGATARIVTGARAHRHSQRHPA